MYRSYFYGLLVITAVGAALIAVLSGEDPDEVAALSVRIPEPAASSSLDPAPMTSSSLDPAPMMDSTIPPTTAALVEHDGDPNDRLTTTTLPPTTTSPPTTSAPATQPTETQPKKPAPAEPAKGGFNSGYESDFASSINSFRSSQGLGGLSRDGSLDAEARAWAKRMAERGDLSHSNIGRFLPPWSAAAENVGQGGSVSSLFKALTGSSGHRANMLGGYTHFGIGVWVDGSGTLWTTHVFTG